MRSTKFWIAILGAVFAVALATSLIVFGGHTNKGTIANIYQNGACIYSIDLTVVEEGYTLHIGGRMSNTVLVERGRICIGEASCPDHVCIKQGWISNGVVPIVCLPNSLVIQIEGAAGTDIDAMSR